MKLAWMATPTICGRRSDLGTLHGGTGLQCHNTGMPRRLLDVLEQVSPASSSPAVMLREDVFVVPCSHA